ncbi:WW domain binding protein 11 [Penicillium sp. DV-2018c]|nr:WW domain binding protein 11 [Penicillium sp. DV-2018c]
MPKDKERTLNPAAAQRKQEKQKELRKGKSEALARRNEKLARRNPDRIQRQIDSFKEAQEAGQELRPRDKELLEALEKDLRAVLKAREALGDKAPRFERGGRGGHQGDGARRGGGDGVLGKRRRGSDETRMPRDSDSSETDEDVRRIPMPRDTPPPIPRQNQGRRNGNAPAEGVPARTGPHPLPSRPTPVVEPKTVYEAKPQIRDLRQEATSKFVPAAVRMKQKSIKGQGKLLEPEEMDKLEKAGYNAGPVPAAQAGDSSQEGMDELALLEEQERRFREERKMVHMEEVEDEQA